MRPETDGREERSDEPAARAWQSLVGFALATASAMAVIAFTRVQMGKRRAAVTSGVADLAAALLGIPAARDALYLSSHEHRTRSPAD